MEDKIWQRADISQIDGRLFLSGAIVDYNVLSEQKITVVINMREEQHDDVSELTKRGIAYYWIPVADWGAARSDQIKSFFAIMDKHPTEQVLIHCAVGKGRSAMLTVLWVLTTNPGFAIEDAIKHVKQKRPVVDLTGIQLKKIYITCGKEYHE